MCEKKEMGGGGGEHFERNKTGSQQHMVAVQDQKALMILKHTI